jgi:hypothetical protein
MAASAGAQDLAVVQVLVVAQDSADALVSVAVRASADMK